MSNHRQVPAADRAVFHLRRSGPMTAGQLGWLLWGETTRVPMRGEGSHGTNKFCRQAGKLLKRLAAADLVYVVLVMGDPRILWKVRVGV